MTKQCTCKAEHWQPHAEGCPAKVVRVTNDVMLLGDLQVWMKLLRDAVFSGNADISTRLQVQGEELLQRVSRAASAAEPPAVHRKWPGEPPHCPSCDCGINESLDSAAEALRQARQKINAALAEPASRKALPEHVHSWDGDQCHYCHIPRSAVKSTDQQGTWSDGGKSWDPKNQ